jgi:hypothetical protein
MTMFLWDATSEKVKIQSLSWEKSSLFSRAQRCCGSFPDHEWMNNGSVMLFTALLGRVDIAHDFVEIEFAVPIGIRGAEHFVPAEQLDWASGKFHESCELAGLQVPLVAGVASTEHHSAESGHIVVSHDVPKRECEVAKLAVGDGSASVGVDDLEEMLCRDRVERELPQDGFEFTLIEFPIPIDVTRNKSIQERDLEVELRTSRRHEVASPPLKNVPRSEQFSRHVYGKTAKFQYQKVSVTTGLRQNDR